MITECSYIRGTDVYLEEDCDMGVFLAARKAIGVKVEMDGKFVEDELSEDLCCEGYTPELLRWSLTTIRKDDDSNGRRRTC